MTKPINIRKALNSDHDFILSLSPDLANVAKLSWHSDNTVLQMQDKYALEMLNNAPEPNITLIAEQDGTPLGFILASSHKDDISEEMCGTVNLLAVSSSAQKMGVGKLLINSVEQWAKNQSYRLLHLEVFANNSNAQRFYENLGFEPEMLNMIKPLK
ncbi:MULTISPECIES: GNAT family N-acetyltransferase [Thalassotalea]|uniref:GNAT family N-acetyltransferase n=1 Tax=Thalassotalea castellviae TaxID=3075612 RepID=A0ABU3A208_9GAMM|nr:GNAT family N-acetyltransferase [Thalassotalea sp. W431]MDT0604209.1 GNAT family N-acetyltransferase [Thalassotalea sp. W431]